jgi:hypothetical protein
MEAIPFYTWLPTTHPKAGTYTFAKALIFFLRYRDGGCLVSLKNIITHILQEHGFEAYEREGILYAEKGDQLVSVGIYDTSSLDHLHDYARAVFEVEGTHIFCIPGEAGDEAQSYAGEQGIVIWNKRDLEKEIGQAIIAHAAASEASTFQELLLARAPEPEFEATPEVPVQDMTPVTEGTPEPASAHEDTPVPEETEEPAALDISDVIIAKSIEMKPAEPPEEPLPEQEAEPPPTAEILPPPTPEETPPTPEETPPELEPEKLPAPEITSLPVTNTESLPVYVEGLGSETAPRVVKMRLTLDDVKEISNKTVMGFKHDLELVPHYLFEYICIFEGKESEERKNRGLIAVNAFTGKYSAWDSEPEFTDEISGGHVQLEPKIDEPAAKSVAMQGIIETNREYDEVIVERDHATIIEKAVFAPKEENIVLEKRGLVMVPVWCVEGSHGVMILDGTTGKIISEDYYQETRE